MSWVLPWFASKVAPLPLLALHVAWETAERQKMLDSQMNRWTPEGLCCYACAMDVGPLPFESVRLSPLRLLLARLSPIG